MVVIFILCTLPGSAFPKYAIFRYLPTDKLVHFFLHFVLTFFFLFAFYKSRPESFKRFFGIIFLISLLYGILIELLQATIYTYRSAEVADVAANILGSLTALYFCPSFLK